MRTVTTDAVQRSYFEFWRRLMKLKSLQYQFGILCLAFTDIVSRYVRFEDASSLKVRINFAWPGTALTIDNAKTFDGNEEAVQSVRTC